MKKLLVFAVNFLLIFAVVNSVCAADTQWSSYGELATDNIADGDDFMLRDVSDTTMAATGTQKRLSWISLKLDIMDQYDTIYIDAGAMIPCTTHGALQGTYEYNTNDLDRDYFAFDGGATVERVQYKCIMPESWDRGTVKVKFRWSSATGSTASDTCEWAVKAGAFSDGDPLDVALGSAVVISDALLADNGGDGQLTAATPALTIGGTPAIGDEIFFEFYRNGPGTDDMAEDGWLLGAWVQFKRTNLVSTW